MPPEGHDFPLDFHWKTKPAFIARAGVSLTGHPRALEARNSIMTSLVRAALAGQGGWVSYSRSKWFYRPLARYEGTAFTYDRVLAAVQELLELGLIEEERALPGPASHGWQSRMRATDRLVAALRDCPLQHVGPRDVIELRDADGERMAYVDTDATRRLRRVMEARNEAIGAIRVTMPEKDGWIHTPGHVRARSENGEKDEKGWVSIRPTPVPQVVRIYGRGRWDMHGRLYGWWQQLPQARRIELLINGEVAFEEDWSACHPNLLYAMAGKVPVGDIYDVHGYDPKHVKAALLTVMNTRTTYGGVLSLMKREKDDPGEWPHSLDYTKGLMRAVTHRHEPIAHLLGADMGIRLMHIESEMCVEVLRRCERENIPALPVHDSFVTQTSKGAAVTAIMAEVMDAKLTEINPCQPSIKTRFPPQMGAPAVSGVAAGASAFLPHGDAMVMQDLPPAPPARRPGKAVSRPVRPSSEAKDRPTLPVAGEVLPASWDRDERTLALVEDFQAAARTRHRKLAAGAASGWGQAPTASERRLDMSQAKGLAEWMVEQERSSGLCVASGIPYRLSDAVKARLAKRAAPKPRRPMLRPRKPSTVWAQPQGSLFPGPRP